MFYITAITFAAICSFDCVCNHIRIRPQSRMFTQSFPWTGCRQPLTEPVRRSRLFARLAQVNQTGGITHSNWFMNHPVSPK